MLCLSHTGKHNSTTSRVKDNAGWVLGSVTEDAELIAPLPHGSSVDTVQSLVSLSLWVANVLSGVGAYGHAGSVVLH